MTRLPPASFSSELAAAGYSLDTSARIWNRVGHSGFAYSDGDDVETRIGSAVASAKDVSLFSPELRAHQIDWPSIYHLSPARANLLRPIAALFADKRVLEVGAGCGAITRYLGEAGADVVALEGSARRARVAADRCRDLPNVAVLCERFDALPRTSRFDVVTLVGVLEYARLYTEGDDPVQATLSRALDLLTDDGVLVVAIENQLGLKYFAGVHEDHLGRAMAGIQDHYDDSSVVTFGRAELEQRIASAGFQSSELALPFPDYKLPQAVVLPAGYAAGSGFDAAALAGQAVCADRQLPPSVLFSMGQAFGVLGRNQLLADLSNSFLMLGRKSTVSPGFSRLAPGLLAEHFATERHAAFVKSSRFVASPDGIQVSRKRLCPDVVPPDSMLLSHHLTDETYLSGAHYLHRLEDMLSRPGWNAAQMVQWLLVWRDALAAQLPDAAQLESIDATVPGSLVDAIPRNLIISGDEPHFFDLEWQLATPLSYGYMLFRALLVSLDSVTAIASPAEPDLLHVPTLLRKVFRQMGMIVTAADIQTYLDIDAAFNAEVNDSLRRPLSLAEFDGYFIRTSPRIEALLSAPASLTAGENVIDAERKLHLLRDEQQAMREQLIGKDQHTDQLERRVGDLSADAAVKASEFERGAAEWRLELEAKRHQVDELERRVEELIQAIETAARAHEVELATLRTQLDGHAQHTKELERHAGNLTQTMQATANAHEAELHALRMDVHGRQQHSDLLERRIREVLRGAEQSQAALEAFRHEAQTHSGKVSELAAALSMESSRGITLRFELEARDSEIQRLTEVVSNLRATEKTLHTVVDGKNNEIHRLWGIVDELRTRSDQLADAQVGSRNRIDILENELLDARRFQSMAIRLEHELQLVMGSRSWKLTSGLRAARSGLRKIVLDVRSLLGRIAERSYRALPIPPTSKNEVKAMIFGLTGGLLKGTNAYQRWHAHVQGYTAPLPALLERTDTEAAIPDATRMENTLWEADGLREWSDYMPTRQRIDDAMAKTRVQKAPEAIPMIDFGTEDPDAVAHGLILPVPPEKPDVTILIPAFNHVSTTLECIASIASTADPEGPSFEVIVANDGSTDDSASVLSQIANLRIVNQPVNLGFLLNCNAAAPLARGRYLLLLNNDVQVTEGWLGALVDCIDSDASVAAVGPKIIYPSGWLQEAGTTLRRDGTAEMVGLNDLPDLPRYSYTRDVDYCSGACLLLRTDDFHALGGFDEAYAPAYCEDSDLCMRLRAQGRRITFCAESTVVHHLSKTSNQLPSEYKQACISRNLTTFTSRWRATLDDMDDVRTIAFYLPQFHPMAENNHWWGQGFTEWTNVAKAKPNYLGHYQPRIPADLGYYDLRLTEVMEQQANLARRYGVGGFCFYYYWFAGKRLLERPIEQMLATGRPDFPFCLCWANENWTRRWDGREQDVLMAQMHSDEDDLAVIRDLMRYFRSPNYIRVNGRPLILIYRITLFPDFARTAARWRQVCRDEGLGDIYIAQVESFEMVSAGIHPQGIGCDAAVEFPPQGMAETYPVSAPLLNPNFEGALADYRDLAVRYATRDLPAYKRFMGVMPGWDNTARRQDNSYTFEHATPGAFQAWLETAISRTKQQYTGDERLVFINAWNEWAEGAYLEPDRRFGHSFLAAHANARDSSHLVRDGRHFL